MPKKISEEFKDRNNYSFIDELSSGLALFRLGAGIAVGPGEDIFFEYVNRTFASMCKFSGENFENKSIRGIFGKKGEEWHRFISDCLSRRDKKSFNACLPGNKKKTFSVISRSIDENSVIVEFRDITPFLKKEGLLEAGLAEANLERDRLKAYIESIGDTVEIIDPDFRVILQNKAARDAQATEMGDFCYVRWGRKSVCDPCPAVKAFRGVVSERIEKQVNEMNGTGRYVSTLASPVYGSNGVVTSVIKIVRDVTERRHVERSRSMLIHEQQKAMAEVKKLAGLLNICPLCKKIRGNGHWHELESYIRSHSEVEFQKMVCPTCKSREKKKG